MGIDIRDFIGVDSNQKLLDSFCNSVGISAAIIDLEGNIIIGSRWQRICTDFHRAYELSYEKCIASDITIANCLKEGEKYSLYSCQNGLVDAASPIIVEGKHIANAFVGQFLIKKPDVEKFRKQAKEYGFDKEDYLQALSEVPIIEESKVRLILEFLVNYAEMFAEMILKNKKQLQTERKLKDKESELKAKNIATKMLEEEHKRLSAVLDGISEAIYVSDPDTYELLHVNEPFKKQLGEDNIGKKCYKVLQNRNSPCLFCTNKIIFGECLGRTYSWEFQNDVTKDWYRCSDKAVQWTNGKMVRFEIATNITNITKLKSLEAELKRQNNNLGRSNKELEQFAYVASHDLQEPLRMVASYTELLSDRYEGKLDDKADKYIGYAVDGAKRMQVLINDLLAMYRVNTRGKDFEPTDCNKLLKEVLKVLEKAIEDKQAKIEVDDLPVVIADKSQLLQLFQNLVSNALKFHGEKKPVVKISAKKVNKNWIFSIEDNGIGIDPKFFDRIFIIFQRLHGRESYKGSGMGLAISKKIVERHEGKIWVESDSENPKGSTFKFSIRDRIEPGKAK